MKDENRAWLMRGLRDGIPIALGYFAVAFSLGIAAKNAGLTPFQSTVASLVNNASAGEFAGFTLIAANATYLEMAIMELVVNARYLLMSCALSQKIAPGMSTLNRMAIGFEVTDEVFGICISLPDRLENPRYPYGAMLLTIPGWAAGTYLGTLMGAVLPARLVSALSVALYGMFIAIIVPPARKSRILLGVVLVSMLLSTLFYIVPFFSALSAGLRIIILTVVISAAAALLFPRKEESAHAA